MSADAQRIEKLTNLAKKLRDGVVERDAKIKTLETELAQKSQAPDQGSAQTMQLVEAKQAMIEQLTSQFACSQKEVLKKKKELEDTRELIQVRDRVIEGHEGMLDKYQGVIKSLRADLSTAQKTPKSGGGGSDSINLEEESHFKEEIQELQRKAVDTQREFTALLKRANDERGAAELRLKADEGKMKA